MKWRRWIYTVPLRCRSLFRRTQVERELEEELRFHLERQTVENAGRGLTPEQSRQAALRALGGLDRRKEECRQMRKVGWIEDFAHDVRHGLRMLHKNLAFTTVAVTTLALGVGANTAIFSVVNAVLLRPLPYPHAERLFALAANESLPDLEEIELHSHSFAAVGGINVTGLDYTGEAEPQQVYAALCTAGVFPALGVKPAIGRAISPQDDRYGGPRVAVLSHGFWQRHFAGAKAVLGRSILLSGHAYTVIGVMPPSFWKPGRRVDVLVALRVANPLAARYRGVHFLATFLRLKRTVTPASAQADIDAVNRWLARTYPQDDAGGQRSLVPLHELVVGKIRLTLLILFGAVGFVLLIACVNFANLLLARAAARQREIVTRKALGARSGRLLRQMLAESIPVCLLGAAAGLLLAKGGILLLLALKPEELPRLAAVHIDGAVLAFTLCVAVSTSLLFGLLPAWSAARIDVNAGLKENARGATVGAATLRWRMLLVAAEAAMALVLLAGAGLLIRSFRLVAAADPGFRADNVLTLRVELPEARYRELATQRLFRRRLLDSLNALPNMQAGMVSELPMSGDYVTHNFVIAGRPAITAGEEPELQTRTVGGDYFATMGIPLLRGRDFSAQDDAGTLHVAIVNQAFARKYFARQDPLGARIAWARDEPLDWMTIVGIVGDVKHFGPDRPEEPAAYDLYSQTRQIWKRWMFLVLRSNVRPASIAAAASRRIWSLDKQIPPTQVLAMEEVKAATMAGRRFTLTLMSLFAALALTLAVIGIYGVTAYAVTQRTQEIGVRMALGARRRDVLGLVIRQCALAALAGGAVGMAAALAMGRLMSSLLFGITAHDPITFATVAAGLSGTVLLAAWLPARRAMRIEPTLALRYE